MESILNVEVSVKAEPANTENEEISNDKLLQREECDLKEEVWIKPEPYEEHDDVVNESEIIVDVEFLKKEQDSPKEAHDVPMDDEHENKPGQCKIEVTDTEISSMEIKESLDVNKEITEEKPGESNDNNETSEKKQEEPFKEKYIMYSYEITKNIQIVTINEEERQIEHTETKKLRQHMKYFCEDCALGFVLEQAYLMHMKVHSKESGEHECEICHTHLKTADMLYRHRLRHYRRYRCLLCWTRFKDKDTAACHVMKEHIGTAFQCDTCGRSFKRPQYLKRHVEQYHTKPHRLECAVCFRVFHERGWYRSHIRTHNEEVKSSSNPVQCDICSRQFKNKSGLKRHIQSHLAGSVVCDICQKMCKNRNVLAQHYHNVHQEKYNGAPAETCEVCLRVCATRAMLLRHVRRMHSDRTKKYQCDHCQRYYLTKGEVRAHIAWSHLLAGGHACACGRVFRTPALRAQHAARVHLRLPPPREHACEHCGKAFANKQVLNRHKKSHTNEMYPCNECGLLFKTQPYVKIHYQIKHLNMTRAEVNAQRKLNKRNKIPQNNLHVKPNKEKAIKTKKVKVASESDPLLVQDTDVNVKLEKMDDDNVNEQVPLFQTYIDVNKT